MGSVICLVKKYSSGQVFWLAICLLLGISSQVVLLLQPNFGGRLIDAAQSGASTIEPFALLCFLFMANAVLTMAQQAAIAKASERLARGTRQRLLQKFFDLPVLMQEMHPGGWYSQRITSDVESIKKLPGQLVGFAQALLTLLCSMAALLAISPLTFLVGLAFGCLSFVFSACVSKPLIGFRLELQTRLTNLTTLIQEDALTGRMLRACNAWGRAFTRCGEESEKASRAGYKMALLSGFLSPVSTALMQLANIGTILLAAWQVAWGHLTFSALVVFLMYFSYFSSSVSQMTSFLSFVREARAGDDRLCEMESLKTCSPVERGDSVPSDAPDRPIGIEFRSVSFSYPGLESKALNDVSFSVPPGKMTAIVGASGGGKTSCIGLMEGFYSPSSGSVLFNGVDLRDIDLSDLRGAVGFVDQDSTIVSGTVSDNLKLSCQNLSQQTMRHVLDGVGLDLGRDPLDKDVGGLGRSLSGGQRQRLAVARAVAGNPRLLILDEPTSSLDGIAERDIDGLIRAQTGGATVVYSAHRLSSILAADWLVVLKDGRVKGQGPHEELYESCGYYRALIDAQAQAS